MEDAQPDPALGSVAALAGDLLTTMCRGSKTRPLPVLGEAEEVEESRLSGSVVASAGDLLTTMYQGSPASRLADSGNGPLMIPGEVEEVVEGRPSAPGATPLVILDSTVHSSDCSNLLTRLTPGFPVSVGGATEGGHPLAPPKIVPSPTVARVWANGPLGS